MSLVAFSIRLDRIDESLLYEARDGSFWLSCVCTFDEDAKGRLIVAQSISKERFAAGGKRPSSRLLARDRIAETTTSREEHIRLVQIQEPEI